MSENMAVATFFSAIILLTIIAAWRFPRLGRRDLFFGVTVEAGFRDDAPGRAIERRYRAEVALVSFVALALVAVAGVSQMWWLSMMAAYVDLVATAVVAGRAGARTRPYAVAPTSEREAALAPRRSRIPGGVLALGPYLVLGATALALALHWPAIPDRVAVHGNLLGEPDSWRPKSFWNVYGVLVAGFGTSSLALLAGFAAQRVRRTRAGGELGASDAGVRALEVKEAIAAAYVGAIAMSILCLPLLGAPYRIVLAAYPVAAALIAWDIRARFGAGRRRSAVPNATTIGDNTPDEAWHCGGLFYVNRRDPALLVQTRFGLGTTLNLGRPVGMVIGAAVIGAFVASFAAILLA